MRDRISSSISRLAEHLLLGGEIEQFRKLANEEFHALNLTDPALVEPFFHNPPPESPHYDSSMHGLGGWLSCCQFAAFELIYNFGEEALPFLREIAWGEYDWTQGNAIELMIRLAADRIATDAIINEIRAEFPEVRHEASLYAIEPLIPRLDKDPGLKDVFERLLAIEYFRDAYDELTYVDEDPCNLIDSRLHGRVTKAWRGDPGGFAKPVNAVLEVEGLDYFIFADTGGAGGICIANDSVLLNASDTGTSPVSLDELLRARRIAVGYFSTSFVRDNRTWICPATIAVIDDWAL